MNYKALEDLINILVRKCGTELNAQIAAKETELLTNRLRKVQSDIKSLEELISNRDYKYNFKYVTINQISNYSTLLTSYNSETKQVAKAII